MVLLGKQYKGPCEETFDRHVLLYHAVVGPNYFGSLTPGCRFARDLTEWWYNVLNTDDARTHAASTFGLPQQFLDLIARYAVGRECIRDYIDVSHLHLREKEGVAFREALDVYTGECHAVCFVCHVTHSPHCYYIICAVDAQGNEKKLSASESVGKSISILRCDVCVFCVRG